MMKSVDKSFVDSILANRLLHLKRGSWFPSAARKPSLWKSSQRCTGDLPVAPTKSSRHCTGDLPIAPTPPTSRRLDHQHIPRLHRHFLRTRQLLTPAIGSLHPIPPNPARLSAGHAEGRDLAMIGEDARREGFQESDSPYHPIAAPEAPTPPLPLRIANFSSNTGKRCSRISGSVSRELVMWVCTALAPWNPGPAPAPPQMVS
uniref:Uncharacterized protein n=1 Tax=Candidatus Kentrum sp. LPFa TaxID=2126335 RepID=A0A450W176_9GAMM|nr:MAG: hypothetical protein BECKLPF1236B_GA0070989_101629 [Candidatus Kentron sp. LPFa]